MFTPKRSVLAASLLVAMITTSLAETPNLGKPIDEAAIAAWDISILPDGTGLPKGSGTPAQGAVIFAEKCSAVMATKAKAGGIAAAVVDDRQLAPFSGISAAQKTIKNSGPIQPRCSISFAAPCRLTSRVRSRTTRSTHSRPTFFPRTS